MDLLEIMESLRAHIKEEYKISDDDQDFDDDINIFDYGYVDSFGAVVLTNYIKVAFDIEIDQADMIEFPMGTIREISIFVFKRKNKEI